MENHSVTSKAKKVKFTIMRLGAVTLILFILCALEIAINSQEIKEDALQIERHDIHRIVLKPEKRKHKKRAKSKTTRPPVREHSLFELPELSAPVRYQQNYQQQQNVIDPYAPFDDVRDLMKPRPPPMQQVAAIYPEEDSFNYREAASNTRHKYVQKPHNSDWNPIPSTLMTYDYHQKPTNNADFSTATTATRTLTGKRNRNKQTKPRRKPEPNLFKTTTTPKSLQFPQRNLHQSTQANAPFPKNPQPKSKSKSNATHYVTYNHNNKSHVDYDVSTSKKPKPFVSSFEPGLIHIPTPKKTPPQQGSTMKTSFGNANSNSYEVFESTKDYNKQIKQTHTLIPPPVYPPLRSFLPGPLSASSISENMKALKPWP